MIETRAVSARMPPRVGWCPRGADSAAASAAHAGCKRRAPRVGDELGVDGILRSGEAAWRHPLAAAWDPFALPKVGKIRGAGEGLRAARRASRVSRCSDEGVVAAGFRKGCGKQRLDAATPRPWEYGLGGGAPAAPGAAWAVKSERMSRGAALVGASFRSGVQLVKSWCRSPIRRMVRGRTMSGAQPRSQLHVERGPVGTHQFSRTCLGFLGQPRGVSDCPAPRSPSVTVRGETSWNPVWATVNVEGRGRGADRLMFQWASGNWPSKSGARARSCRANGRWCRVLSQGGWRRGYLFFGLELDYV